MRFMACTKSDFAEPNYANILHEQLCTTENKKSVRLLRPPLIMRYGMRWIVGFARSLSDDDAQEQERKGVYAAVEHGHGEETRPKKQLQFRTRLVEHTVLSQSNSSCSNACSTHAVPYKKCSTHIWI